MEEFELTGSPDQDFENAMVQGLGARLVSTQELANESNAPAPEIQIAQEPSSTEVKTTTENVPEKKDPPKTDPPIAEPVQLDLNKVLSEVSKGRIKTQEDLEAVLSKKDLSKFPEIESIYDHLEKKGTIESYFQAKNLGDVQAMDNLQAIRKNLEVENPDLTQNQIDRLMNRKYPSDPEVATEDEIEDAKIALVTDGRIAKAKLQEFKDSLLVPKQYIEDQTKAQQRQKEVEDFQNAVSITAKTLPDLTIPIEGDKVFTYTYTDKEKADIEAMGKNALQAGDFWYEAGLDDKGTFSMTKMLNAMFLAKNHDKVLSKYSQTAKSLGIEELKGQMRNTQEVGSGNPLSNVATDNSNDYAIAKAFYPDL